MSIGFCWSMPIYLERRADIDIVLLMLHVQSITLTRVNGRDSSGLESWSFGYLLKYRSIIDEYNTIYSCTDRLLRFSGVYNPIMNSKPWIGHFSLQLPQSSVVGFRSTNGHHFRVPASLAFLLCGWLCKLFLSTKDGLQIH